MGEVYEKCSFSEHFHPFPITLYLRCGGGGGLTAVAPPGVQGRYANRPCRRLFLAFAYQTTWFQQLPPTQVRLLVLRFRMTS